MSEFELVASHLSHRPESCTCKNSYKTRLLFLDFEEQTNFEAVFKEELVEDVEIIGDYFMTVAMDYVLSKFIVLIAHLDMCITRICQSHLYGVGELGGTCNVCVSHRLTVMVGKVSHEGTDLVWDGDLITSVS